ncbi:MAG: methyltransferase domain-containing protein [Terracidiphilus sp.]
MASAAVASTTGELKRKLRELALRYPPELVQRQLKDVERIAFHISLIRKLVQKENPVIADIGGGVGLFSSGCAALGMKVTLADDFRDQVNFSFAGVNALALHRELGVTVQSCDVIGGLSLPENHFDAITSFDSMEHWHHSPKKLFHGLIASLRQGGWFIVGVPNCVNLRKRITVPFGIGKWSQFSFWYDQEVFRGHVREPDVDDLRAIGVDLGLQKVRILGRNWLGYDRPIIRRLLPAFDRILSLRPSLCADIYLVGRK